MKMSRQSRHAGRRPPGKRENKPTRYVIAPAIEALIKNGRFEKAAAVCRDNLAARPGDATALTGLGVALWRLGRAGEAIENLRIAQSSVPSAGRGNILGQVLMTAGRLEEAVGAFDDALSRKPNRSERAQILANYAEAKRFGSRDDIVQAMEGLLAEKTLDEQSRLRLHFALGKALDDIGEYDQAFGHFSAGNRFKRNTFRYDVGVDEQFMANIAHAFDHRACGANVGLSGLVKRLAATEHRSRAIQPHRMIFVVGMPRSGTTLAEQILASHSQVVGIGERNDLKDRIALRLGDCVDGAGQFPEAIGDIDTACLTRLGEDYIGAIEALAPGAKRIVDKTPMNFMFIGLIRRLWPNARVVACTRDARDTCLSCFTKHFEGHQHFSYDLAELARYHVAHDRLMDHWHTTLPGFVHRVPYETLVDDFEPQVRRLLAFCGLEFEPQCLAFHETQRDVRTASAMQVRQPLYQRSVARWRRYEPHLDALSEFLKS